MCWHNNYLPSLAMSAISTAIGERNDTKTFGTASVKTVTAYTARSILVKSSFHLTELISIEQIKRMLHKEGQKLQR